MTNTIHSYVQCVRDVLVPDLVVDFCAMPEDHNYYLSLKQATHRSRNMSGKVVLVHVHVAVNVCSSQK